MDFNFPDFHRQNRSKIIEEWARRLNTEVGEQYARRPIEELYGTCTEALDANFYVIAYDDFSRIDQFIDRITRIRLEAGFLLSDVQKAFELYRSIVIPLLAKETNIEEFQDNINKINRCLAYTIHRFSDHFQNMHEKKILEHNRRLEEEVRVRTTELRESELKYKTLVEEITDGYFVIQDEVIVFANQAYCQMHGFAMEEILGKKFHIFIAPEDRDKVIKIYNKSLSKKTSPRSFEYLRLTKEGETRPTEIMAKNARYDNKLSSIGICRDISERVKMEQRIRDAERMAYIGQITTSLSHEIRNPLSSVKMNLQILKKNPQLQGNDPRRIDISIKEVIRLEGILSELLDFAKPLYVDFDHAQINHILLSCTELLDMKMREEKLSLDTDLESMMPGIWVDKEKLGQAFINLLLNAIEASRHGGKILIKSRHHQNGGSPYIEVVIQDQGHGIKEEYLFDIFKPFFTTKSKGTGLGLANVKRIVEAHGGWVEAANIKPSGGFFRVSLPIGTDHGQDTRRR